jgi:hypothetical protein
LVTVNEFTVHVYVFKAVHFHRFKEDTPSTSTSEIKKFKFNADNGDCKADKQYKQLDTISSGKKSTTRPTPDLSHLDEIF